MKKGKQILVAAFLFFNAASYAQDWILDPSKSYEFSASDQAAHDTKWNRGTPWGSQDRCNNWYNGPNGNPIWSQSDDYLFDLNTVSNSANQHVQYVTSGTRQCLKLSATDQLTTLPGCASPLGDYNYMSAQIVSTAQIPAYSKVEICAKFPKEKGLWYSIWLLGNGTEMDIIEFGTTGNPLNNYGQSLAFPNAPQVWAGNYHTYTNFGSTNTPCSITNNRNANVHVGTSFHSDADLSLDFHIYSYECTPTYIKIKLDGQLAWMISRDKFPYLTASQSCTGQPQDYWAKAMNLYISLYAHSYFTNTAPVPGQTREMLIDYIRVYNMGCNSYVLCDQNTATTSITDAYQIDLSIPANINYQPGDIFDEIDERGFCSSSDIPYLAPIPVPAGWFDLTSNKNIGIYTGASVPHLDANASNIITMHPGFTADPIGTGTAGIPSAPGVVYRAQIGGSCGGGPNPGRSNDNIENPEKEILSSNEISVFPNPSSSGLFNLWINVGPESLFNYELFTITGQKLNSGTARGKTQTEIDISNFPDGLYFIRVNSADGATIKKIIKQ